MKTLSLLLIAFAFLAPSLAVSQVNCTTYFGGVTSCTGPAGYQAEGRQYLGGVESWYDNRGSTATVRRGAFGSTSIDTARTSNAIVPNTFHIPLPSNHINGPKARDSDHHVYGYPQQPEDYSSLPKTPEEYRLSVLWMKAVGEKNFEKAEALKRQIWDEQFATASATDKVEMLKKARVEERLEAVAAMDRVEKRIRAGGSPAELATLNKVKEMASKSYEEEDAKLAILDAELARMLTEESTQSKGKAK